MFGNRMHLCVYIYNGTFPIIECIYRTLYVFVIVYTHRSDKEPYRQVGMDRVTKSGSLRGVMVKTLAQNAFI